jgi:hypothetical protein
VFVVAEEAESALSILEGALIGVSGCLEAEAAALVALAVEMVVEGGGGSWRLELVREAGTAGEVDDEGDLDGNRDPYCR